MASKHALGGDRGHRVSAIPRPSARSRLEEIMEQLCDDARTGRVILCSAISADLLQGIIRVLLLRVPKKSPDRTLSEKGRTCFDQKLRNKSCDKHERPPALQPRHGELARCIMHWACHLPRVPILMTKKDVAEAFKWLWVLLGDIFMLGCDTPGEQFRVPTVITALQLVVTFGFAWAPGEWMIFAWVVKFYHSSWQPAEPPWEGEDPFYSFFIMDANALIEPDIGCRPEESARTAEEGMVQVLWPGAFNRDKDVEHGRMEATTINWGLAYDTRALIVSLPRPEVEKAYHLLRLPEFDHGSERIPIGLVRELRGSQQHWSTVRPHLSPLLGATDALLARPDGQGMASPKGSDARK